MSTPARNQLFAKFREVSASPPPSRVPSEPLPEVLLATPLALRAALHGLGGAAGRWQELRSHGATDAELMGAVARELAGPGGNLHCQFTGGQNPSVTLLARTLRGRTLVRAVRVLLAIPEPNPAVEPEPPTT